MADRKQPRQSMNLRRRIFLRFVGLLALLTVAICITMSVLVVREHRNSEKDDGRSSARILAHNSQRFILWDDRVGLKVLLDEMVKHQDTVDYAFVERRGRPYVYTFREGVPRTLLGLHGELAADASPVVELRDRRAGVLYDAAAAVPDTDAVIHVGLSRRAIDRQVYGQLQTIAAVAAAVLMLGGLLAIGASARVTREVDQHREELDENSKRLVLMGQAVAGSAHCVKNMLNGLQGGFYVLKKGVRKDDEGLSDRGLQMVDRNVELLSDLVKDMLSYSKDREPEYELTNINELVGSVVDLMQVKANQNNTRLGFTSDTPPIEIEVDAKDVYRCILNIVSNALDACKDDVDGDVDVRIDANHLEEVFIEIEDSGCGMDEGTRQSIFRPFFSRKGSEGTGLGLSVTQKIVQEHGGRIEVESTLGNGSVFRIHLPKKQP